MGNNHLSYMWLLVENILAPSAMEPTFYGQFQFSNDVICHKNLRGL